MNDALRNIFDLPASEPDGGVEGQLARSRKGTHSRPDMDRFLEDFISGREPQTTQWIRLASMVASQSFSCDVVIRVLRPNEKVAAGTLPIDKLGISIARKVGAKYSPGRLRRVEGRITNLTLDPNQVPGSRERFSFDKSFLPATARVLVIGDHETPAPTFEAIRKTIEAQLPKAEVKSFTLYWLEEHFRSAPLDDRYFLSSESPLSALSRQANPHVPNVPQEPLPADPPGKVVPFVPDTAVRPESPAPPQTSVPSESTLSAGPPASPERKVDGAAAADPVVAHPAAVVPRSGMKKPAPRVEKKKSRIPAWAALAALAVIVFGVGLVVLAQRTGMFSSRFEGTDAYVIPEPTEAPMAEPAPVQPAAAPAARAAEIRPKGPQGIISVPSAGLRSGPSLDAKPLRQSVRGNEPVTILRRKPSNSGPDWVQIETKRGVVGWVWASVVREGKRR